MNDNIKALQQSFDDERVATTLLDSQREFFAKCLARREVVIKSQAAKIDELEATVAQSEAKIQELNDLQHALQTRIASKVFTIDEAPDSDDMRDVDETTPEATMPDINDSLPPVDAG